MLVGRSNCDQNDYDSCTENEYHHFEESHHFALIFLRVELMDQEVAAN